MATNKTKTAGRVLFVIEAASGRVFEQRLQAKASLSTLQALVEGMIETVKAAPPVERQFTSVDVWANEEGLIHRLPFNVRASALVLRPLVGNVVFEPRTGAAAARLRDLFEGNGFTVETAGTSSMEVQ